MKAYSEDLRLRILAAVDGGMPRREVVRVFGVSLATVERYLQLRRETGAVAPRPRHGPPPIKTAALAAALLPRLEACPDATLEEHGARWEHTAGVRVSTATMSRVIDGHFGWPRKESR
jgi:transposase